MKMKYTEKPTYPEVEIVGKTVSSKTGTIDRRKFGRLLLTEEAGFGKGTDKDGKIVLNGDDTTIQTVTKAAEVEVVVQLVDGSKSAASFKFFDVYTAKNPENEDVLDVFTTDVEKVDRVEACAERMCDAAPGNDGQYKIIEKSSEKRVFLRVIAKNLDERGKVKLED